jgi:hypothetical protein
MPIKAQLRPLQPVHRPHRPDALGDVPADSAMQRRAPVIREVDSLASHPKCRHSAGPLRRRARVRMPGPGTARVLLRAAGDRG